MGFSFHRWLEKSRWCTNCTFLEIFQWVFLNMCIQFLSCWHHTVCPQLTYFLLLPLHDTAGGNVHVSDWTSVCTGCVVYFLENKGQAVKGSHFSSHLSLKPSDTLHLLIKLPVDYRRVCAHAVALYIFRKRFCKRWIIHYFFLGFPWSVICTVQKKNTVRMSENDIFLMCILFLFLIRIYLA